MKDLQKIVYMFLSLLLLSCNSEKKQIVKLEQSKIDFYRPELHFTPPQNWMNDPNGMFFYKGKYHLFYQHNPFGIKWGHMTWGHATSEDMIKWEHQPIAIPEENDIMIFSGSAVVDWNNTSGFGTKENPPIIAIYTGYHTKRNIQEQSIAYSLDEGISWIKYENNPVLDLGLVNFRDPKVMWYAPEEKWVMSVSLAMDRKIQFYSSKDLKNWEFMSDFGPLGSVNGQWECPDLFELKTSEGLSKWMLEVDVDSGSPAGGCGAQYFLGNFDGTKFIADESTIKSQSPYIPDDMELVENFENSYENWDVAGEAFGNGPVEGTHKNQNSVSGFFNKKLVNSFNNGDQSVGELISKPFKITKNYINLLIGGGSNIDSVGVALKIENTEVKNATGENSEHLKWVSWDVSKLKGKVATIQIFDRAKGGWGHINIDHILMSDIAAYNIVEQANWIDFGKDFYGAVTWSDIPLSDGRKLWLGWMNNWQYGTEIPTEIWRSSMSIPRQLILEKENEKYVIRQEVVKEINNYVTSSEKYVNVTEETVNKLFENNSSALVFDLEAEINLENLGESFEFIILNNDNLIYKFSYDKNTSVVTVIRSIDGNVDFHPNFPSVQQVKIEASSYLDFKILVDKSSVELFIQKGKYVFTNLIFPKDLNNSVKFNSENKKLLFEDIKVNFY